MKTKLIGILVLALFLVSMISVIADIEVPPDPEQQPVQEKVTDCKQLLKQSETAAKDAGCKISVPSGDGGFSLAKGKSLFGLTSYQDGYGFGIVLGNVFSSRVTRLHLGRDILSLNIKSDVTQRGVGKNAKAIHLKRNTPGFDKKVLFAYEFLSNLDKDHTIYTMEIKVASKDKVKFLIAGKEIPAKLLKKHDRTFNYYELTFQGKGTIEVIKV